MNRFTIQPRLRLFLYGSLLLAGLARLSAAPPSMTPRSAAEWRARADICVAHGAYEAASEAFHHASVLYARLGDPGAAKVLQTRAERYETQVRLFYHRPMHPENARNYYTGKRLEPLYGAYLGAFIDREDGVQDRYLDENTQSHKDSGEFNRLVGKRHAVFFMYMRYGGEFPGLWMEHLRGHGAAAQWVLSPEDLNDVRDDDYLHGLAEEARQAGLPIFLRFAGEMNGDWVPYHNDPALYIAKFRLVARVFHETAPNVAMVWCVNDVPEEKITRYYPGEEWVDWVGVNFYSVTYNNGDAAMPAWWRNPADSLRFVYQTYAARHPIMIGEYAATHLSRVDGKPCPDFTIDKIGQLYAALPRLYPRVKAINWLSMDTFKYAESGRRLNNYSLLENSRIIDQYHAMISSPYFLDRVTLSKPNCAGEEIAPMKEGTVLTGRVTLSAWVKTYEQRPKVVFLVGGRSMRRFEVPGHYAWTLDTTTLPNGPTQVVVEARDSKGRVAGRRAVQVRIENGARTGAARSYP